MLIIWIGYCFKIIIFIYFVNLLLLNKEESSNGNVCIWWWNLSFIFYCVCWVELVCSCNINVEGVYNKIELINVLI